MAYNLTERQKALAIWLVDQNRNHGLKEEFLVYWMRGRGQIMEHSDQPPDLRPGMLDALANEDLIKCSPKTQSRTRLSGKQTIVTESETSRLCVLLARISEAVDSDFESPDTSFITHVTPLADITNLDDEIKLRCLPVLGAGSADPVMWDAAMKVTSVILEERLRKVARSSDLNRTGIQLANDLFGNKGKFASYFKNDALRQGYRDLYAGIMGVFRNPSSHRFIDPTPEDGGAFIVFINVLLKMLDILTEEEDANQRSS